MEQKSFSCFFKKSLHLSPFWAILIRSQKCTCSSGDRAVASGATRRGFESFQVQRLKGQPFVQQQPSRSEGCCCFLWFQIFSVWLRSLRRCVLLLWVSAYTTLVKKQAQKVLRHIFFHRGEERIRQSGIFSSKNWFNHSPKITIQFLGCLLHPSFDPPEHHFYKTTRYVVY